MQPRQERSARGRTSLHSCRSRSGDIASLVTRGVTPDVLAPRTSRHRRPTHTALHPRGCQPCLDPAGESAALSAGTAEAVAASPAWARSVRRTAPMSRSSRSATGSLPPRRSEAKQPSGLAPSVALPCFAHGSPSRSARPAAHAPDVLSGCRSRSASRSTSGTGGRVASAQNQSTRVFQTPPRGKPPSTTSRPGLVGVVTTQATCA